MCDYLQIFVSDDEALDYVVNQLSSGLAPRHVVIAHSTVAPHSMTAAAELVEARGARFVEAPFTGSKEAAEKGELVYYVGGDEAAIKEARPILEATSKQIMEIGQIGHATAIKLATNLVTAATIQSAAEALALVQAAGVPLEKFAAAMQGNASNSASLNMKLPKMMQRNFDAHFSVKHMLKDIDIASRLALSEHLELGVCSAARERLLEQLEHGHGDEDYSAVIRKYFPDEQVAASDQSDLELFASATPAEQPPEETIDQPLPFPETGQVSAEENASPAEFPHHIMPTAYTPAATETPSGRPSNGDVALAEDSAEEFSENQPEDESAEPRGFLSRLLRR
jgi:3-hydroxyisobutyrate dehydrogenase-like beta-hydroxyacid dehydrogenase